MLQSVVPNSGRDAGPRISASSQRSTNSLHVGGGPLQTYALVVGEGGGPIAHCSRSAGAVPVLLVLLLPYSTDAP